MNQINNMKNKVPAFTIMEVTISMLVAAIVVAMTYSAYGIITRSWLGFTLKNEQMAVVLRLDQLLRRDFEQCEQVLQEPGGLTLLKSNASSTKYLFTPEYIVRTAGITDTFKIKPSALRVSFEGKLLDGDNGEEMLGDEQDTGADTKLDNALANELAFSLTLEGSAIPFHYKKAYSAVTLMTLNP